MSESLSVRYQPRNIARPTAKRVGGAEWDPYFGFAVATQAVVDPSKTIGIVVDVKSKDAHGPCLVRALAGTKKIPAPAPPVTKSSWPPLKIHGAWASALLLALVVSTICYYVIPRPAISHLLAMQSFIQQEVAERPGRPTPEAINDLVLDKYKIYHGGTCIQSQSVED